MAAARALGLRAGLAVVRLVEEIANLLVPEHPLVHPLGDGQPVRLKGGYRRLDSLDGLIVEGVAMALSPVCYSQRHGDAPAEDLKTAS